jgi:hypothetical protein
MLVKLNGIRLWKREWASFFSSLPWFSPIFRLVPISGILCESCSIHLSYSISSTQVVNFMSCDIPSKISM